jgi:hypothetical protein
MFRAQQNAFDDVVGKSNLQQLRELGMPACHTSQILTSAFHSQGD